LERKHFDCPLYNKRVLSQQFAAYRKGSSNPRDLFEVVFYIELWHLLFVDKDSSTLSDLQPSHPPQRLL
jgi:hypothetical protein